jgi:protein KRI1
VTSSYVLNRGWIDKSKNRVPTYREITSNSKSKQNKSSQVDSDSDHPGNDDEGADFSDSSFDSLVDTFETSYNFRFEEPNSSTIPSFPRSISSLVRREDTKRKDARERRKTRKVEEMEKKREEVRRLKALKMREIRRKLEIIGREGGIIGTRSAQKEKEKGVHWEDDNPEGKGGDMDSALRELDLEGDWDPAKHDQQMAGLFVGDGEGEGDWEDAGEMDEDGKPVWKDDVDIGDMTLPNDEEEDIAPVPDKKDMKKKKKKKKGNEDDYDDTGVDVDAMDADVQAIKKEMGEEEEWDGTEEMRKRKLDEYMNEIYNLDFNDVVREQKLDISTKQY